MIGCTLAVDMLYGFVNVKWGDKLLKVLFLLGIFEVNKYLIVLTLLFNFVAGIIIMDYLGTTNNDKACLWSSNCKKVPCYILDKF